MHHSYRVPGGADQQGGVSESAGNVEPHVWSVRLELGDRRAGQQEFDIDDVFAGLPGPDYNVAPTVAVPAVFERRLKDTGEVRRRLAPLVWGLVPSWAKDVGGGARMINARVESVAEKPAFRRAFAARRCLLPADGFYEWYTPEATDQPGRSAAGKVRKQPFFIRRADGGLLVMAGIYEIWRDPTKDRDDDSAWLRTCSVITTAGHRRGRAHPRPDADGDPPQGVWTPGSTRR